MAPRRNPPPQSDYDRFVAGLGAADREFAANMAQGFLEEAQNFPGAVDPLYLSELETQAAFDPLSPAATSRGNGPAPFSIDRTEAEDRERRRRFQQAYAAASGASPSDWEALIEALGARDGGGGYTPVTVDRSLFRLAETPEEQALLARELADIEARREAGTTAVRAGWAQAADANRRAAEKARTQVLQYGDAAAAGWTDAAQRAQQLASARAQQAGAFEGRQSINVSPTGGAEDFIMFMESQAPAARQYAEGMQNILAEDLDWMAQTAGMQGQAYSADLQRQANMLAFERAREHNRAVQERINAERMALADMQFRASTTNAQLAQQAAQRSGATANEIYQAQRLAIINDPTGGPGAAAILATLLNLPPGAAATLARQAARGQLPAIIASEIE